MWLLVNVNKITQQNVSYENRIRYAGGIKFTILEQNLQKCSPPHILHSDGSLLGNYAVLAVCRKTGQITAIKDKCGII